MLIFSLKQFSFDIKATRINSFYTHTTLRPTINIKNILYVRILVDEVFTICVCIINELYQQFVVSTAHVKLLANAIRLVSLCTAVWIKFSF